MNIKSINSIDSIENQSASRQANNSGHSTPTTPQSPKIEKRASNDNFGGLNGMEKTEIIQKLINVQKQYVKVSHYTYNMQHIICFNNAHAGSDNIHIESCM